MKAKDIRNLDEFKDYLKQIGCVWKRHDLFSKRGRESINVFRKEDENTRNRYSDPTIRVDYCDGHIHIHESLGIGEDDRFVRYSSDMTWVDVCKEIRRFAKGKVA